MTSSGNTVPPLIPDATPSQVAAILGAMRAVAETGAPASEADRHAITSAGRYLFGHKNTGFDAIAPVAPQALVSALGGSRLGEDAAKFLTVMALVDGTLDKTKISTVLRYAQALGLHERYLDDIAAAAADRLQEALADMTRSNMESITGPPLARRRSSTNGSCPTAMARPMPRSRRDMPRSSGWRRIRSGMSSGRTSRTTATPSLAIRPR